MPNLCDYAMKIKGSKNNRDAFIKKMKDYNEPNHFWRIFEAVVEEEGDDYTIVGGDCAWSLESCCRASGYSNGIDLFEVNTFDMDLTLEAYSSEPGMGFEEHYIYKNGECIIDECVDMQEYWWDMAEFPTFEEFKEEFGLPSDLTEDDLSDGEWYKTGGFATWDWSI